MVTAKAATVSQLVLGWVVDVPLAASGTAIGMKNVQTKVRPTQNEVTNALINHAADSPATPFPRQIGGRPLVTQDFRIALAQATLAAERLKEVIETRESARRSGWRRQFGSVQ